MKTREQIIAAVKAGRERRAIDGRDLRRLTEFFPPSDWPVFGFDLKGGMTAPETTPFTQENVRAKLATDVAFGFYKALTKRGISASCMYGVVKMWMWVLDDEELGAETDTDYPQYGLPFMKAVAIKYGLPNPIGDKRGDEEEFAE